MVNLRRVDRIAAGAKQLRFGRALLMTVAAPFYALGWLIGSLLRLAWTVTSWLLAAVEVGYRDARRA